jgi:hypothetical protein
MESSSGFSGVLGADGAVQRSKATTPLACPSGRGGTYISTTTRGNRAIAEISLCCSFEPSVRSGLSVDSNEAQPTDPLHAMPSAPLHKALRRLA